MTMRNQSLAFTRLLWTATAILLLTVVAPTAAQNPPTSEFDVPSNLDIHYIDLGDGGDNPWKPGCHWHYGTKACKAPEFFFMGDYCSDDGQILYEWTDSSCHKPKDDLKEYDCEKLCQEKHGTVGRCIVTARACRPKLPKSSQQPGDSASCVCKGKK